MVIVHYEESKWCISTAVSGLGVLFITLLLFSSIRTCAPWGYVYVSACMFFARLQYSVEGSGRSILSLAVKTQHTCPVTHVQQFTCVA